MKTDPNALVHSFAQSGGRFETYLSLIELGEASLPALRAGLKADNWKIRHWSAICLDRVADSDALADLVPLLEDPHAKVRLWAVHALACDHCKDDVSCPTDVVPLLIKRLEQDDSIKVRRMAAIMLSTDYPDERAVPLFERLLGKEHDPKLLLHLREGLDRIKAQVN